jgi:hypothetical protein
LWLRGLGARLECCLEQGLQECCLGGTAVRQDSCGLNGMLNHMACVMPSVMVR